MKKNRIPIVGKFNTVKTRWCSKDYSIRRWDLFHTIPLPSTDSMQAWQVPKLEADSPLAG